MHSKNYPKVITMSLWPSAIVGFAAVLVVLFAATSPAVAWPLNLVQDLGVNGQFHYCRYSDGKTYSFNAVELCPITTEGATPGMGNGMGFLKGEYQDGMTKVCVYDVLGQRQAIRLGATELCPLTETF